MKACAITNNKVIISWESTDVLLLLKIQEMWRLRGQVLRVSRRWSSGKVFSTADQINRYTLGNAALQPIIIHAQELHYQNYSKHTSGSFTHTAVMISGVCWEARKPEVSLEWRNLIQWTHEWVWVIHHVHWVLVWDHIVFINILN